jgi:N-acetylmuramoyl-L-alanine amidase
MGLSLLLPLLKINFWQQGAENNQAIRVLRAVSVGDEYMNNIVITANSSSWNFQNMYPLVYWLVSLVFFFVLVRTLFIIRMLLKKYPVQQIEEVTFVNTSDDSTPFSFFKYIFWNSSIDMSTVTGKQIFKHEVAHIQEKHTYDKLFVNILLIFCWCNPFFWLYRKELNMIHEFIADKKAVEDSDTAAFAAMILQTAYPKQRFELTNNFFYSPIKRRLLMLTKIDNPRVSYFVRVMALPLVVLVFAAFTFKAKTNASVYHGKKITVVIDAGHGGQDLGAKSIDGIYEKNFTLAIAKKVKELNISNDIEIVLTRENDITQTPQQKLDIAESKQADLLISFHCDAQPVNTVNKKSGLSIYISKDNERMTPQSKLLASSVIESFKLNYSLPVNETLGQRYITANLLKENSFPAIIIQTGFITTPADLAYLKTPAAKETIAKNVLAAIKKFANSQLEQNNILNNTLINDTLPTSIFINAKHSDTNYTKSNDFKNKALVIVDSKEIGNVGINYIDQSNEKFSTAVVYNRAEAQKIYGPKGKYGVIKLTKRDAVFVTADTVFFDEKTRSIKLSGSDINLKGDYSDALIYLENKIITADQLKAVDPKKIDHISVLQGDKLNDVTDAKGKKSVIYISLKANDLPEVTIKSKIQTQPLYVIDGVVKDKSFNLTEINKNDILSIDILKDDAAIKQYGDKGKDGVIIIKTKNPNKANSFSTAQTADIEAEKTLQKKKLAEQENKVKLDLEARTVKGKKISDGEMAALKLQLASIEKQKKAEVDPVEKNVQGRKMTDGELADLMKQKILIEQLSKAKADDLAARNIQGRKMTDKELANLKQNLQLEQQNKAKANDLAEITVEGKKLSDQQIQELKQRKLLQEQQAKAEQDNKIFIKMEVSPKFTGGDEAWRKYLQENLNANTPVDEGWKAGKYTVIVKFIVHTDGTVTDVTTENYKGSKTANECIRVIKNAPKWIPAIQNGRNVNAYKKQPITFLIEEAEEKIKSEASNIFSVPLKVHLMNDGKVNTYNMVGNGTFTVKSGSLYFLNGKIISNPQNIPSSSVIAMESYDEASGQKYFGDKGKYGVLLLKTKS